MWSQALPPQLTPRLLLAAELPSPVALERESFGSTLSCIGDQRPRFQPQGLPLSGKWLVLLFPGWNVVSVHFSAISLIERGSELFRL